MQCHHAGGIVFIDPDTVFTLVSVTYSDPRRGSEAVALGVIPNARGHFMQYSAT